MSIKKLTEDNNFPKRLSFLIKKRLGITQASFCKNIGITTGYLSMIISGKRGPSADLIAGIYLNYSEHMTWLLTGKEATSDLSNDTKVVIKHQNLVKNFKNPERGLCWNERLIDIEDASEDLCEKVDIYLRGVHDAAKVMKDTKLGNYSAPSSGATDTMSNRKKPKLPKGAKKNGTSG